MSRLENFLNKNKENQINFEIMEKIENSYQCTECDEYSSESYFDQINMMIYWQCKNDHVSKVSLVGESRN